jgi:hypothetical protein
MSPNMLNQIDLKPVMDVMIMQSWPWMSLRYMAVLSGVAAEMWGEGLGRECLRCAFSV